MKKILFNLILALGVVSVSRASAPPDLSPNYFILKDRVYNQTSDSTPVIAVNNSYQMINYVEAAGANTILSGTLTPPVGGSPIVLSAAGDGHGDFMGAPQFQSLAELDAAYVNGSYTMAGTGLYHGAFSASLSMSGTFTNQIPQITGGAWSFGNLQASNTAFLTLNWSLLAPGSANDEIFLRIEDNATHQVQVQTLLSGTATTYTLSTLLSSGSYNAMVGYLSVSDTNTAAIFSSTGYAGHFNETDVTVVSVPEPSSIALVLSTGLALFAGRSGFRKFRN